MINAKIKKGTLAIKEEGIFNPYEYILTCPPGTWVEILPDMTYIIHYDNQSYVNVEYDRISNKYPKLKIKTSEKSKD